MCITKFSQTYWNHSTFTDITSPRPITIRHQDKKQYKARPNLLCIKYSNGKNISKIYDNPKSLGGKMKSYHIIPTQLQIQQKGIVSHYLQHAGCFLECINSSWNITHYQVFLPQAQQLLSFSIHIHTRHKKTRVTFWMLTWWEIAPTNLAVSNKSVQQKSSGFIPVYYFWQQQVKWTGVNCFKETLFCFTQIYTLNVVFPLTGILPVSFVHRSRRSSRFFCHSETENSTVRK